MVDVPNDDSFIKAHKEKSKKFEKQLKEIDDEISKLQKGHFKGA
jgi:peptidoglycan hydrolase CwlO-like protein